MYMRLFLVDKPGCDHITDLMPGISAVYQLEQEFYPYLLVEFLPNRKDEPGIILQAGDEIIKENYTFDKPSDIEEVRLLIWKYLLKYHNITDIAPNGCITDFRKTQTNHVTQGWQARKRERRGDQCCKIVGDLVASEIAAQIIKHEVYRVDTTDKQTRYTCKQNRYSECGNNFPPNTQLFNRCVDEVNIVCDNAYPFNKYINDLNIARQELKNNILEYLHNNDMKVNKQILDQILDAGFFECVSNRAGNNASDYGTIRSVVDEVMSENNFQQKLIETLDSEELIQPSSRTVMWFIIVIIILFIFSEFIRQ